MVRRHRDRPVYLWIPSRGVGVNALFRAAPCPVCRRVGPRDLVMLADGWGCREHDSRYEVQETSAGSNDPSEGTEEVTVRVA